MSEIWRQIAERSAEHNRRMIALDAENRRRGPAAPGEVEARIADLERRSELTPEQQSDVDAELERMRSRSVADEPRQDLTDYDEPE